MESVFIIVLYPLCDHGFCFLERCKMVKPNTFLFQRSEKSFHNSIPIRFPFGNIFLCDSPVTCTQNVLPGQEYRSVVMTNLQPLWNSLFGAIPSHYSLIQSIRCLTSPTQTVKTISCNLTAPIVNHWNQLAPSIPTTVNLGQIRRPEFIRSIHRGPHPLNRFSFSTGSVPQQALPTFKSNNTMHFLFISQETFLEPQMRPNPPITKRFLLIKDLSDPQCQTLVQIRLPERSLFFRTIQRRSVQAEGSRNNRFGVTPGYKSFAQSSRPVFFKRATSCKISTWRVNWPILRSNLPISLSEGSFRRLTCSSDLPASRNRSRHWNNWFWLIPFVLANSSAFEPFSNSKTTDVFRLAVQRSPFLDLGSGKSPSFHRPQFAEKMSTSQGGRNGCPIPKIIFSVYSVLFGV